jgi:hypothetical protein
MKRRYWAALGFTGFLGLLIAAAPNPRYLEELAIGGGFGDAVDGGAILERDGDILTDGKISAGAASANAASLSLPHGSAPTTPTDGDLWTTTAGLYSRVNSATVGPVIDASGVPWAMPGAIGTTTANSGEFTTGDFSDAVTLSGSTASLNATAATHFFLSHKLSSGATSVRFSPEPNDGTSNATVDFFRLTNTTGYVAFLLKRGDGTNTNVFEVKTSSSSPKTYFRNTSGTAKMTVSHDTGNLDSDGDGAFDGGDLSAGTDTGTRGVVTAWDGSGGSAPGVFKLASPNGTVWNIFIEDDGTLKVHSALPTQNSDGSVVGSQT